MITITNERLMVQIDPLGAQMHSIKRRGEDTEYLWQGDAQSWSRQAPVLFPFVGRLKDLAKTMNIMTTSICKVICVKTLSLFSALLVQAKRHTWQEK